MKLPWFSSRSETVVFNVETVDYLWLNLGGWREVGVGSVLAWGAERRGLGNFGNSVVGSIYISRGDMTAISAEGAGIGTSASQSGKSAIVTISIAVGWQAFHMRKELQLTVVDDRVSDVGELTGFSYRRRIMGRIVCRLVNNWFVVAGKLPQKVQARISDYVPLLGDRLK
jgi:hypothetical protein